MAVEHCVGSMRIWNSTTQQIYINRPRLVFLLSGREAWRQAENDDRKLTLGPGPCGLRAGLATEGGGHDLWGEVEEVSQVLDALVGEIPVEVAPGKLLLDVPTRLQGLQKQEEGGLL